MDTDHLGSATWRQANRTSNACVQCKSRKTRCDGKAPSCGTCAKRKIACHYAVRRRRGPGKSKKHVQVLEDRLKRVENTLKKTSGFKAHEAEDQRSVSDICPVDEGQQASGHSVEISTQTQHVAVGSGSSLSDQNAERPHGDVPSLEHPVQLLKFPTSSTMESIKAEQDLGCFPRKFFTPLPPKTHTMTLMASALRDLSELWPLFDGDWVFRILDEQYAAGPADCHDDPARWATINAMFAVALQWKAADSALDEMFPMAWAHFKNAFSIFPELVTRAPDLETCRATLIMAIFMLATADVRTAHSLLTSAIHSSQVIGLHRKDLQLGMSLADVEQRERVFWTTCILSSNAAIKYGLPTSLSDEVDETDLPRGDPSAAVGELASPSTKGNIPRFMARLSVIQSEIHKQLYSGVALRKGPIERQSTVTRLDRQLELWRLELPIIVRPAHDSTPNVAELGPGLLHLHFAYYCTAWKIRIALLSPKAQPERASASRDNSSVESADSNMPLFSPPPAVGARATILLLRNMPLQPFTHLWQLLGYAVCAVLILVSAVVDDPSCPEGRVNITSIGEFILHLRTLQRDQGYALESILAGCYELYTVVCCATKTPRDTLDCEVFGVWEDNVRGREEQHCTDIHLELFHSMDIMHVSQGLMTNLPIPCAEAAKVFSKSRQIQPASNDGYGPFVPDLLKAHTYKFFYGPRP